MKPVTIGLLLALSVLAVVIEAPLVMKDSANEVLCKETAAVYFAPNKNDNSDGHGL